jgi:hypothetical protein
MLEAWHDGQVRDPHEDMAHLTLSIVAKTLFGTDIAGEADVVGESLEVVINHFMSPMRWFRFFDYLPLPSSRRYWLAIRRIDDINGGRALVSHDRAAISPRDRAGADSRAPAFDHPSAPTPDPCAAQGQRSRGDTVSRSGTCAGESVTDGLSSIDLKIPRHDLMSRNALGGPHDPRDRSAPPYDGLRPRRVS